MRKLIYAVLGLVALLVAAIIIAVLVVDLNQYKGDIEAELETATGRDVTLGGNIHVTFWPSIGAAIDDVQISNIAGGSPEPMLRAETLHVVVAISPLLSGNVQVESIRIVKPTILIETYADGGSNLTFEVARDDGAASSTPSSDGDAATPVQIDQIDIIDGTITYRDAAAGRDETIEHINLSAQARSLQGPFQVDGRFTVRGVEANFAADIGSLARPSLPINLRFGLDGQAARLTFAGQITGIDAEPKADGSLLIQADSLAVALAPFVAPVSGDTTPLVDQPFELNAQVAAGGTSASLLDLALSLGDLRATGDAAVAMDDGIQIDLALVANHLDGDILSAALGANRSEAPVEEIAADSGDEATSEQPSADEALPDNLSVSADLKVDAVTYRDGVARQVHLIATLEAGTLTIQQLTAGLPGGTSLAVAGEVESDLGEATFRGQVELASDNMRAVLDWLQLEVPGVLPERLRRVDLFASVSAEPGVVVLTDTDLSLDSSRLTGTLAMDWTNVPTIIADVSLDRINLDAYLNGATTGAESDEPATDTAPTEAAGAAAMFAISPLPNVNADIKARVGSLTYNGVAISNLLFDGLIQDGRIELRNLAAAVADASVRATGVIDPATTTVSVRYAVEAPSLGPLSRLLNLDLPISPRDLGAVNLTGSIEGDTASAEVKQRLETALGAASVDGILSDPMGQPGFKGRVGLRSESYLRLARAFGTEVRGVDDSAIAFAADVDTDGVDVEFNAVLEAADATLRASGTLAGLTSSPSYDLRAKLNHDELADLLKALGAKLEGETLGLVDVTITAKGDRDALAGQLVSSTVGPSTLNGTLDAKLDGERPYIDLRLTADTLALDPILAAGSGGTVGDTSAAGGDAGDGVSAQGSGDSRWSSETIDLAALRSFDGRIQITGGQITLQDMVFTDPVIVAVVTDGTLQLEQFRGGAFDGQLSLTGDVTDGDPHRMNFDVNIADADAQQVLRYFADTDEVSGRLFITGKVSAAGASQRALVESLSGDAALSMKDGVLEGFDVKRISDRLGNLDNEAAAAALLSDASSGGNTKFTEVEGTFIITDGIARSDDLRALVEAGAARFTMVADLPKWLIDLQGVLELTEHETSPKIKISVTGPIDNPERVIDSRELQAFLVQRLIETAIRKYGDGEGGSTSDLLNILTGNQGGADQEQVEEPEVPAQPSEEQPPEEPVAPEQQADEQPAPEPQPQELNAETLLNILTGNQGGTSQQEQEQTAPEVPAEEPKNRNPKNSLSNSRSTPKRCFKTS